MKAIIQRVRRGQVTVESELVGQCGKGFVVLVGVTHGDVNADADYLANKIANLRIFEDAAGKMNLSALDLEPRGELLVVSQFTLYADTRKGRRPSFLNAALPDVAEPLVHYFVNKIREIGLKVETGQFGAEMLVAIENDGPVTIVIDSAEATDKK
ncbi:MAG: D-tyrosyl-tRNA(Tyr) deacylase [Chloroflexi bacterium]|uniref:D-aminoacyl-tRNA deacylase n=1 Tax=Candidatus Chlorohelix allophototropha TaxID=3003348 RepID=A0A8T7LSC5_9CHLR|nr:D-tyrosyl-tRNA(Tyr) deacylase [Chloroflexota bacterium]WJW66806.1 D-aminoacyl-tRNA deacylase [Chloroflexota bacterium L227-S17]